MKRKIIFPPFQALIHSVVHACGALVAIASCFRCPNFVPDFDTGGREGKCRMDERIEITNCQGFCAYGQDLVPF